MAFEGLTLLSIYGDEDDEFEEELEDNSSQTRDRLGFEFGSEKKTSCEGIGIASLLSVYGDEIEDNSSIPSSNDGTATSSASAIPKQVSQQQQNEEEDVDRLDKFLPPPPQAKCSEELQLRVIRFLAMEKSFESEVRNKMEYRNPDFLMHAVTKYGIDPIGSCFLKEVFDPHGHDKSQFFDDIVADMEKGKKTTGGSQQQLPVPTPKIGMATRGARDDRSSKKSKWISVLDAKLKKKSKRIMVDKPEPKFKVKYQLLH